MDYEIIAHILAIKDRPFTRWHELSAYAQDNYRKEAKRLVSYGAQFDAILETAKGTLK